MTQAMHVLVLSDENDGITTVRVHRPFAGLIRLGRISGYTILRRGRLVPGVGSAVGGFGAIWVHRADGRLQAEIVARLGLPFVYDIDDNLLAVPGYRQAFSVNSRSVVQDFLARATVVSCATQRLAGLLERRAGLDFGARLVVSPNLTAVGGGRQVAGPPQAIIWASSDRPALMEERDDVVRAVADHCRANRLRLVCIGAPPPVDLLGPGVEIEAFGVLPYADYTARLRDLGPSILVCPLATNGDPETLDFVNGKSDIKALEARSLGLVGVFSRAAPYLDSDVAGLVLCDNSYAGWRAGLETAQARCLTPGAASVIPAVRRVGAAGLTPLAAALGAVRLAVPLGLGALIEVVEAVQATVSPDIPDDGFDADDYLDSYSDVRDAIELGLIGSAYQHYSLHGRSEGRAARWLQRAAGPDAAADDWRASLLQLTDRLETTTRRHAARIAALDPPRAAPQPAAQPASPGRDWRPDAPAASQCPICGAAGPIPPLLAECCHVLHRCPVCRTCFYADRAMPDYATQEEPGFYQQFFLEQNCSIHHATRFLFMVENPAGSVLDVGCGFGHAVDLAAKALGWRAVGMDPSHLATAGRALLGEDIRTDYLTASTSLGEPFGLVVASEVIEHVPDPAGFVGLLRRWMQPGSTLILTTPDADAITPEANEADMVSILALGVHLFLFSGRSLALLLRRCGFAHVEVESRNNNLVAVASDAPIRPLPEGDLRHMAAYRGYLEHLVGAAEAGTPLWNGAAGRLMQILAAGGDEAVVHRLYSRIAEAWRHRYGIDLLRLRLPELLPDAELARPRDPAGARAFMWAFGARQPINLATVLFCRAVLEARRPGRLPEDVLRWARPAWVHAVQALRVLLPASMIDLDLRATAGRAKVLITDCLVELAPELEADLLLSLATASPPDRRDWQDVAPPVLVARMVPSFLEMVRTGRLAEAKRLKHLVGDAGLLAQATAGDAAQLFETLAAMERLGLPHDEAVP